MKCIVLSNSKYRKKDGSGEGYIANVAYLRKGEINIQQAFGLENVFPGDIVSIETDLKGFPISHDVVGKSDALDLLVSDLQNLS
jgi:hypothetical protein